MQKKNIFIKKKFNTNMTNDQRETWLIRLELCLLFNIADSVQRINGTTLLKHKIIEKYISSMLCPSAAILIFILIQMCTNQIK